MGPFDLLNHLLNFMTPAFFIAVVLALAGRAFMRKSAGTPALWKQMALSFGAGVLVLFAGLLLTGRDGKMLTYAALVVCCASVQWLLLRGWRK